MRLMSLASSPMYLMSARASLSLASGSMRLSMPPTACLMLLSSPMLRSFSFRSMNWAFIFLSLK